MWDSLSVQLISQAKRSLKMEVQPNPLAHKNTWLKNNQMAVQKITRPFPSNIWGFSLMNSVISCLWWLLCKPVRKNKESWTATFCLLQGSRTSFLSLPLRFFFLTHTTQNTTCPSQTAEKTSSLTLIRPKSVTVFTMLYAHSHYPK